MFVCFCLEGVLCCVLLHEGDELLNTLDGHGVVDGGAEPADRAVAAEADKADLLGLSLEVLGVELLGAEEGDIHEGAVLLLDGVAVVVGGVDVVVASLGYVYVLTFHLGLDVVKDGVCARFAP